MLTGERGATAAGFHTRAIAWFVARGVRVFRLLTDSGGCYRSHGLARSAAPTSSATRSRGSTARRRTARPSASSALLAEWAYAQAYRTSRWRTASLPRYLSYYNTARPHTALQYTTPAERLAARQ